MTTMKVVFVVILDKMKKQLCALQPDVLEHMTEAIVLATKMF